MPTLSSLPDLCVSVCVSMFSLKERLKACYPANADDYFELRQTLIILAKMVAAGEIFHAIMQDPSDSMGILLRISGRPRQLPQQSTDLSVDRTKMPLIPVTWRFDTKQDLSCDRRRKAEMESVCSRIINFGPVQTFKCSKGELQLLHKLLETNHRRIDAACLTKLNKQQPPPAGCRHSFITPIRAQQLIKKETKRCAFPACNKAIKAKKPSVCGRCKRVYYCGNDNTRLLLWYIFVLSTVCITRDYCCMQYVCFCLLGKRVYYRGTYLFCLCLLPW